MIALVGSSHCSSDLKLTKETKMNALTCRTLAVLALAAVPSLASARGNRHADSSEHGWTTVLVENETSTVVTVSVDSGVSKVLGPYQTELFPATGKYAEIEATYVQFGERRMLTSAMVPLSRGRTTQFEVRPVNVGLMKLVNETGVPADVYADGREIAELRAGDTQIVKVPLGHAHVEMIAHGYVVARLDTTVRAFAEPTLVGRAPTVASVTVVNPFPFDLRVSDERGNTRTIAERGRTVFTNVPVGSVRFVARRVSGDVVDDERVAVRSWTGATWTPDPPTTGLVRLDSNYGRTARVLADGRIVAMVSAYDDEMLRLPVGNTTIEVRDLDGALLARANVDVDAWRTTTVNFDAPRRSTAATDADAEHGYGNHEPAYVGGRDDYGHDHAAGEHCDGRRPSGG